MHMLLHYIMLSDMQMPHLTAPCSLASFGSACSLVNLAAPADELEDGTSKDPVRSFQEPRKLEARVVPAILVLDDQARLRVNGEVGVDIQVDSLHGRVVHLPVVQQHLLDTASLHTLRQPLRLRRPCQRFLLHVNALEQLDEGDECEVDLPRRSHVHQGVHKPGVLPVILLDDACLLLGRLCPVHLQDVCCHGL